MATYVDIVQGREWGVIFPVWRLLSCYCDVVFAFEQGLQNNECVSVCVCLCLCLCGDVCVSECMSFSVYTRLFVWICLRKGLFCEKSFEMCICL